MSAEGKLVAGRQQPVPCLAERFFHGPTLAEMWNRTAEADAVLLDLKEHDQGMLDAVVEFLRPRMATRHVLISTRDASSVLYLRHNLNRVELLFPLAYP